MELVFKSIIIFTIFQRIGELFISKRNERKIILGGGIIVPEKNYILMVFLHVSWLGLLTYFAFFTLLDLSPIFFYTFFGFFIVGQILRITAILTLGKRWSTRILILPNSSVVKKGIFNYIKHPNYLGVVLEIAALPLMANLWLVSLIFSFANAIILFFRIREEERNLKVHTNYAEKFSGV